MNILNPSDFLTFMNHHALSVWVPLWVILGACIASFGGVIVDRLPLMVGLNTGVPDMSVSLSSPSQCPSCKTRLNMLALVPVLGWLFYRGKCFSCGTPVPGTYPALEAVTGLVGGLIAYHWGVGGHTLALELLLWAGVIISWADLREHWIPDSLSVPLVVIGLLATPFETHVMWRNEGLALAAFLMFVVSKFVGASRQVDAVSGGDVMLAAAAGAWLGVTEVPAFFIISTAVFLTYAHYIASRRATQASAVGNSMQNMPTGAPFGPALCSSLLICAALGKAIAMPALPWM